MRLLGYCVKCKKPKGWQELLSNAKKGLRDFRVSVNSTTTHVRSGRKRGKPQGIRGVLVKNRQKARGF